MLKIVSLPWYLLKNFTEPCSTPYYSNKLQLTRPGTSKQWTPVKQEQFAFQTTAAFWDLTQQHKSDFKWPLMHWEE